MLNYKTKFLSENITTCVFERHSDDSFALRRLVKNAEKIINKNGERGNSNNIIRFIDKMLIMSVRNIKKKKK